MPPRSLTRRIIPVDVLTASYRICGSIEVTSTGVTGAMNDDTSGFLKIQHVTMARVHMPDKLVKEVDVLRLVKDQIHMICLQRRQDVGPQALARGGFERVQNYNIEVTTSTYEYEGVLEWAGRFDFSTVMAEGTRDFVPLYEARIRAVMLPNVKIKSPVVLFNRKQVATLLAAQQT